MLSLVNLTAIEEMFHHAYIFSFEGNQLITRNENFLFYHADFLVKKLTPESDFMVYPRATKNKNL